MALATIKPSPTQLLGRFGGPKWIPKELPDLPRSVLERFGVQNALQMSSQSEGKSSLQGFLWVRSGILSRLDLPKRLWPHLRDAEATSWNGLRVQNGVQMISQSEGKSSKKCVFLHANWLFRLSRGSCGFVVVSCRVLTCQNGCGLH